MSAKEVYDKLKMGERILVVVNEKNQPVGAAGKLCTTVMRYLIEEPNLCPPDAANWPEVKQISGVRLLRELRGKFSLPLTEEMDIVLLHIFNSKFRNHKYKLKKYILKKAKEKLMEAWEAEVSDRGEQRLEQEEVVFTEEELLQALEHIEIPPGFTDHQWGKLKSYFMSTKFKALSTKGKVARASQIHSRTTGATSFARKRHEFEVIHKRQPREVEFFEITHVKKNGSYVQDDSREFMNVAKSKIFEKMADVEPSARAEPARQAAIEKDVMMELMGPDKPGSARGHGIGVTKSKLSDFSLGLRRMRAEGSSSNHVSGLIRRINNQDQVIANQDRFMANQAKKIEELLEIVDDLRSQVQIINVACEFFGERRMQQPLTNNVEINQVHNASSDHNMNNTWQKDT
ncbi:hypothetical protein ACFE04_020272 [Oxalis oulophora]